MLATLKLDDLNKNQRSQYPLESIIGGDSAIIFGTALLFALVSAVLILRQKYSD